MKKVPKAVLVVLLHLAIIGTLAAGYYFALRPVVLRIAVDVIVPRGRILLAIDDTPSSLEVSISLVCYPKQAMDYLCQFRPTHCLYMAIICQQSGRDVESL